MFSPIRRLPLARRLPAYLLVCGLGGIVALLSGLVMGLEAEADLDREIDAEVYGLRDRIVTGFREDGGRNVTAQLVAACSSPSVAYCGVVDAHGRYVAHSVPQRVGSSPDLIPTVDAVRLSFPERTSPVTSEYRMPLTAGGKTYGTLQVGVCGAPTGRRLWRMLEHAPPALLAPIALLVFGAAVVRRTVEPASAIEDQLRNLTAPASGELPLELIDGANETAEGWNRLVERSRKADRAQALGGRLGEVVGGLRERRADRILSSLSDGVAATDRDGNVTFANGAFAALIGVGREEELLGRPMAELLSAIAPNAAAALPAGGDAEHRASVAELHQGRDLAEGVFRVAQSPIVEPDGRLALRVWTLRDVTQQKLAEEMRNQFVYSATHELRTPLANIKALAETLSLEDDIDPEQHKEFCNTINSEVTRLARFVDELLDLSRIETGALTLTRHEVDVQRLLAECAQKVQGQVAQKGLRFELKAPPKLPAMKLDKDAIAAALVNLLSNAVKYTPEGGSVEVVVEHESKELRVHVQDSGIGIPADEMPRLFKKFFRGADPRVRAVTGTGLGLAFSYEVTRLHGGRLSAVSEPNQGSRFTMTLPVA